MTLSILNVRVDAVDMPQALSRIDSLIASGGARRVVTVNLEYLRYASANRDFAISLSAADLSVADGFPVVLASRILGRPLPCRVTGVDLASECARLAEQRGYRLFLLGAQEGVAQDAARVLKQRHPKLLIAGTYTPPMGEPSPLEERRIAHAIRLAHPHILLVALPTPRQELWIHRHAAQWGVPVTIGVGAAFDMICGRVRRAPRGLQRCGFEWLFRLAMEPRRLWRRYIVHDIPVFLRAALWCLKHRRQAETGVTEGGEYEAA